jgi:hypothetical protein
MAIQPIDLQTLIMQMDTVGKQQAVSREGAALHQAVQTAQTQRQEEEKAQSIRESQDLGDNGLQALNDKRSGSGGENSPQNSKGHRKKANPNDVYTIQDPNLGNNVDLIG